MPDERAAPPTHHQSTHHQSIHHHVTRLPTRPVVGLGDLSDPESYVHARTLLADRTDLLLDDVRGLDDDDVRRPSLCPGWSRAHVLSHVARNADAMVNLLTSARTGRTVPMYASPEARDGDIEAGAMRSAGELEADVESSAERFLAALVELPEDRMDEEVEGRAGAVVIAHDLVWTRLREVAYHHVDLDTGTRFTALPFEVVARGLTEAVPRLEAGGAQGMTWEVTDPGPAPERLVVAGGGLVVRGAAADLLAWASGRGDGQGVSTDTGADLPGLPSWG